MIITNERLDYLGDLFIKWRIKDNYDLDFNQFVELIENESKY